VPIVAGTPDLLGGPLGTRSRRPGLDGRTRANNASLSQRRSDSSSTSLKRRRQCFEDEATDATETVLDLLRDEEAAVPALWHLEVANVMLTAERRGRITEAQSARFLDLLVRLPIRVDTSPTDTSAVLAAGRRHRLSAYDAAYLVLAERLAAPLATLDSKLSTAGRAAGVRLLIDN
jgi:predicted nucleic acid-binding protein